MKGEKPESTRAQSGWRALPLVIQAAASSWLLTNLVMGGPWHLNDVAFSAAVSLPGYLVLFFVGFAMLLGLGLTGRKYLRWALEGICFLSACVWAGAGENTWLTLGLGGLTLGGCLLLREKLPAWEPGKRTVKVLYAVCALLLFGFIAVVTVCRYLSFSAPGFDFGIFTQMFESMRKHGSMVTTYERSKVMTHLHVHFSPVYYLMLPLYCLFPSPVTLQVEQALVVALGLLPLYGLCRTKGLSQGASVCLGAAYLLFPALSGSTFYDLHENCFLAFALLLTVYGAEAGKEGWFWLGAALTLSVKEDAGIYLAFLGLYYLLSRQRVKQSAALLAAAVAVFALTTGYVTAHGDGVISSRFSNLVPNAEDGMLAVIRTAITHPGYLLTQCFTEAKVQYLLFMLLPMAPLLVSYKNPAQFLLLGPMLLLNVLPAYKYQYDISFQYHFGSSALLFVFAVLTLSQMELRRQRAGALAAAAVSCVLFCGANLGRLGYLERYLSGRETYIQMEQALDTIPEEASVSASWTLVAHLSGHEVLYPEKDGRMTDYLALDKGTSSERSTQGYTLVLETDRVAIYQKENQNHE